MPVSNPFLSTVYQSGQAVMQDYWMTPFKLRNGMCILSSKLPSRLELTVILFITYRAKLLSADWLRQRAFFLHHEGTFGNQEGMIT